VGMIYKGKIGLTEATSSQGEIYTGKIGIKPSRSLFREIWIPNTGNIGLNLLNFFPRRYINIYSLIFLLPIRDN
jgi:hypothetical protein